MKRRFPVWRGFFGAVAVGAFVLGMCCAREWWTWRRDVADAETAILCAVPDACGQIGAHELPFVVKHGFTHGLVLVVEPSADDARMGKAAEVLAGIKALAGIRRADQALDLGDELLPEHFQDRWTGPEDDRTSPAIGLGWRPPGPYVLHVAVETPAEKLVGVPHRLVLRYQCCGCERLVPAVAGGLAICLCLAGVVVGLCAWLVPGRAARSADGGTTVG